MSGIELILTSSDFIRQQCPQPSVHALERAIDGTLEGIVTYIKLANGDYQTISRYEEDQWTFPASKGTKATPKNKLTLDFASIKDPQMTRMVKWVIWNSMKEGLTVSSLQTNLLHLKSYFQWVVSSSTASSHGLTAFTASAYVRHVNMLTSTQKGDTKPLSAITKVKRFAALESLYHYCKTFSFIKEHPWWESSATEQAGLVGETVRESRTEAKTPIIPNEVLVQLCKLTKFYLDRANELLALRDKLEMFVPTAKRKSDQSTQKRKYLQSITTKYQKLNDLNDSLLLVRDSCIFWLLLTTGMRIHEVMSIKRGAWRSETIDEITYYYIETVSNKTYTGQAEWIAPEIAIQAIDILERYSAPFQQQLESDLAKANANQNHMEAHRLETISNHICLSVSAQQRNSINVLSRTSINSRLPNLCQQINSDWHLSTHQFRRTFANYVIHSELGDLRALKEHFKHWSINMTALYAYNDNLDAELFEELIREKYLVEEEIKQDWFELDTPITGGAMAENIKKIREDGELIKTFRSRKEMAKAYSSSISIRSTGIGWCTNDDECKCGKPDECESGIVDKRHLPYWEGMLVQQMALMQVDDIGEAGKAAIKKGMQRCEKVLSALGMDVEVMKQKISQREYIEVKCV